MNYYEDNKTVLSQLVDIIHNPAVSDATRSDLRRAARRQLRVLIGNDPPRYRKPPTAFDAVYAAIRNGEYNFIRLIKVARSNGLEGLVEAKDFVEKMFFNTTINPENGLTERTLKPLYAIKVRGEVIGR